MQKYPYQNIELKNLNGENWKDIPGLEMYFKVSNYGRIKRLNYELEYSDGRVYVKPEKIIKPIVAENPNSFVNDIIFYLRVSVTLYGQKYNYSIARLVYCCFVKPFNLDDDSIVILTKDRNRLNIKPSNLKMASITEKQQRIFDLNRNLPPAPDKEARQRAIAKIRLVNNKQVTQYNMQGKKIKTYPSAVVAARETGISSPHISSRANGSEFSAGGFIWRYGKERKFNIKPMLEKIAQRRKNNKDIFGKRVTQYKMNGQRVAIFPTINDAAKATGIRRHEISLVLQKKRSSAFGFYWLEGYGPAKIDLSRHQYGEVLRAKKRQKPIEQYSTTGKFLKIFDSIKEAASKVGVDSSTVVGALTGKYMTAGGYKWKYVNPK